jgi:ATP-dependent Clp protease ATP-binding subunit ClpC
MKWREVSGSRIEVDGKLDPKRHLPYFHELMASPSSELLRAVREAEDIAQKTGQPLSTAHLLLALFTFPNRAQLLLQERRIDEDAILDAMDGLPDEPQNTFRRLKERAIELATGAGAAEADCLHLLVALLRVRESLARWGGV